MTTAPGTTATPVTTLPRLTTTTAEQLFGLSERVLDVPGSPLRIRFEPDADGPELNQIAQLLVDARGELGDSGPVAAYVYTTVTDALVNAYVQWWGRRGQLSAGQARSVLENNRASAGQGALWLSVPNLQNRPGPPRVSTIFHEYLHTVQLQSGAFVPQWFLEGPANYFGFRAAAVRNLARFEPQRRFQFDEAKKVSEPLNALERVTQMDLRAYHVGFVAADYLIQNYGEERVKYTMWETLRVTKEWGAAFTTTFGISVDKFYSDFDAYRATL